jgi:filamentous hemagglutinin
MIQLSNANGDILLSAPNGRIHFHSKYFSREAGGGGGALSAPGGGNGAGAAVTAGAQSTSFLSKAEAFGSGVYDGAVKPLVDTIRHPINALEGIGHAIAHPIDTAGALAHAVKDGGAKALSGDPYAIGMALGTVGSLVVPGAGEAEAAEDAVRVGQVGRLAEASEAADVAKVAETADAAKASQVLDANLINKIRSTPKGLRPDPAEYLSPEYISAHLAQFDQGATRFMTKSNLAKYGVGQRDGTAFVMPKREADALIAAAKGDPSVLEQSLGLPEGFLSDNEVVRVDIPNPRELNLRMPSGNEAGANEQWVPGGKLPNGNNEAVVDLAGADPTQFRVNPCSF